LLNLFSFIWSKFVLYQVVFLNLFSSSSARCSRFFADSLISSIHLNSCSVVAEVLEKYSEGLIAMSACLSGDIPKAILNNNYEKAKELALKLNSIFGQDNFYLELQMNGIEEQNIVNQQLISLAGNGNTLVATNDAHYLRREDARAHEILLCIQTGKSINDEDRMRFSSDDFYIKSPEEMISLFRNIPEAISNTVRIADMCNVELEFNKLHLPNLTCRTEKTLSNI